MKLTKISAVIITTLGLSCAAFASEIPQPPIYNPDSIINKLPTGEAPTSPPILNPDGSTVGGKFTYNREDSYEAAHVLGKQVDKNTDAIKDTNTKLDTAITDGKAALAETNEAIEKNKADTDKRIETAITDGKAALAETNGAIKDTNTKLDSSLEEQKKVNYLVGNALASNESYWQQQWATNDNYAASINKNTSDIAKNRQDINKLNSRVDRLDQKVDDLNDTMKRGFASQAALNGLFQPYGVGKLNATMALGGYESKTAIAAGTGYRFDENTAVKAGIATNTDDFKGVTYNVGVNFEW
ncbi:MULTISPECIES: YadA C-terminal domain-containing protein [unclassified Providencia]|uniref:YadA C-terminal domain-containing protein n=1 Tax=Providencia TaxID=586 RepID=UPI002349B8B5|nr:MULTISPECIES: YadA-like family protein [unclassified Providencia]